VPGTIEALAAHEALRYMLGDRVPGTWRLQVGGQWHSLVAPGRGQLTPAARALRDHLVQRFEPLAARLPLG
jgi:hypothetical protein